MQQTSKNFGCRRSKTGLEIVFCFLVGFFIGCQGSTVPNKSDSNRIQIVGIVEVNAERTTNHFEGNFWNQHTVIIRIESPEVLNGVKVSVSCGEDVNASKNLGAKGERVSFELDKDRLSIFRSQSELINFLILK